MSEDVSAFIRLGVSMFMLGELIVMSVVVVAVAMEVYGNWKTEIYANSASAIQSVNNVYLNQEVISAPDAYRLLDSKRDVIKSVDIVSPSAGDRSMSIEPETETGTEPGAEPETETSTEPGTSAAQDFEDIQDWLMLNANLMFSIDYSVEQVDGVQMYDITLKEVEE